MPKKRFQAEEVGTMRRTIAIVMMVGVFVGLTAIPAHASETQGAGGPMAGVYRADIDGVISDTGKYAGIGQLGFGTYVMGGQDGDPVTFTRADHMMMTGTMHVEPCLPTYSCWDVELTGTQDITHASIMLTGRYSAPVPNDDCAQLHLSCGFTHWQAVSTLTVVQRTGYVVVSSSGVVHAFGGIDGYHSTLSRSVTDLAIKPTRHGYWVVNAAGDVFAFGGAHRYGNANPSTFSAFEVVTSIASTPS